MKTHFIYLPLLLLAMMSCTAQKKLFSVNVAIDIKGSSK